MIPDPKGRVGEERESFASPKDIDEFVDVLEKFERGEIDADKFREFRLTRGVYGQRASEKHMVRIKIPQGILSARQLRVLAWVAREKSRGFGHVTTRQNIQFHMVNLADTEVVMRRIADVGITTREACGNTVRNISACPMAGVCRDEAFDVSALAESLTRFLLRHPDTQAMPRKFKIAFSGCANDCAFGVIHDIGFLARISPAGEPGFKVVAGGGLATHPTSAITVEEFLPAELIPRCALAIVRVQQNNGERKNRGRARMKYTIKRLGVEKFLEEYRAEYGRITNEELFPTPVSGLSSDSAGGELANVTPHELAELGELPEDEAPRGNGCAVDAGEAAGNGSGEERPSGSPGAGQPGAAAAFREWFRGSVLPQRQPGFYVIKVRLPIGDLTSGQFEALAELAESVSEGTVRLSIDQNLLLRWVPEARLHDAYEALAAMKLSDPDAGAVDDPTCCPGADTCNLAVTHSRRLAKRLAEALPSLKTPESRGATVKISGCPNSCGQHHVATVGFHGSTVRAAGRVIPAYQLHLGGGVDEKGVTFGRVLDKIPVNRVNDAIERLFTAYDAERSAGQTPLAYFRSLAKERVTEILGDCVDLSEARLKAEDLEDLGTGVPFRVVVGQGECAS
jgi:sulfite reductase (NADPH) hemoprotein beta-component